MYEKVKKYYNLGFYTKKQVGDFVKKGYLTPAQYEEIVGELYELYDNRPLPEPEETTEVTGE